AAPALLARLGQANDRAVEHALTYALIEIGAREATARGLKSEDARVRRAALVALDQMDEGKLEAKVVIGELESADPAVRRTAWWIAGRRPEWGQELGKSLRARMAARGLPDRERDELVGQLARLARGRATQDFLAGRLKDADAAQQEQVIA